MKNKNNKITDEVRNVCLPLAVMKPNLIKKLGTVGLVTFYIMCVISYLTSGFLTNYVFLEMGIIFALLYVISYAYDYIYLNMSEMDMDLVEIGAVIGFSNKILVLMGDNVVEEIDTDEIKVRSVQNSEEDVFFSKYTSVLEGYKDGVLVSMVGIDKIEELEGHTLKANLNRVNEDVVIIYDDEENEDNEDNDDLAENS